MQPTYVTFEQAKLLKDKGFDEKVFSYFRKGTSIWNSFPNFEQEPDDWNSNNYIDCCSRPEQWQVIEWLRIKHGIWIEVHHIKTFDVNRFHLIIWNYKNTEDYITIHCKNGVGYKVWNSPQEAYSAAFDYVLNNLI